MGPLGINFSEIVIEIQTLSLKIDLKMSSVIFISSMEFYIHTWYVYGVGMYKLVNSEKNEMNEKQVKLKEFMIAFEKKSPLILISATAVKVTSMKKHPEASVLSILKLASPLSMHNAASVKHFI